MNTLLKTLLISAFISPLVASPVLAGGNHSHGKDGSHTMGEISSEKVMTIAAKKVNQLATAKKIDTSWANLVADKAFQKNFGHNNEWVIAFNNPKIKEQSKQTLYLFYTLDGHYIAANYTGK